MSNFLNNCLALSVARHCRQNPSYSVDYKLTRNFKVFQECTQLKNIDNYYLVLAQLHRNIGIISMCIRIYYSYRVHACTVPTVRKQTAFAFIFDFICFNQLTLYFVKFFNYFVTFHEHKISIAIVLFADLVM